MLDYRGKYRTVMEICKRTGKVGEFAFIPILGHGNIYRHNASTLNVYLSSNRARFLLREYPGLFKVFQCGSSEMTLLFDEANIEQAAVILKAKKQGRNVSPRSKRNKI